MSELIKLEDSDSPLTGLAHVRNRISEMQTETQLLLANTGLPDELRHYLSMLMDVLSDAAYAARVKDEPGSLVAHQTGELPGRFNP